MCMTKVNKRFEDDNDNIVTGYQFKEEYSKGVYIGLTQDYPRMKVNRWSKKRETKGIEMERTFDYRLGFHIYANKKDVKQNTSGWILSDVTKIVKVQGKGILAVGKNDNRNIGNTYVTRQLKIVQVIGPAVP